MDKKTKIFYVVASVAILFIIVIVFFKIFILHDYLISYQAPCDPKVESCFIVECDQETGEGCDLGEAEKYYKLIEKKAFNAIKCAEDDFNCLLCQKDEIDCQTTICDSSTEENICSNF
ncbi:hypothetical protein KKA93_03130 [Patescibacteria group bacterium]|nr:hypothetical protein [Patescibacteria group bacterium]MBU1663168.1 hypothetical protein [Patescibacteria group bacterium]MBU1934264.1 hypothetical protein [Patescibacteria group bacterium]MBU2007695.1 hypothetical protein [Patescibacteria group bacterium]MBU2233845.1 hypothetical protein [Patescibacteria group bacterium]